MASSLTLQRRSQRAAEESAAFGPVAERFRRAGDLDRAISLCREGLQKFPNTISARVTLGWSLLDQGKYDEARVELEQVLRRAPDNLAAIRGLAELHDRAEHTMNLPMDGPGQWPPDDEAVDHAFVEPEAEMASAVSHDALATAVQFTADADIETESDSPAVFTTTAAAMSPSTLDDSADLEAEADLEALIAQAVAAEVAAESPVQAETVAHAEAPAAEAVAEAVAEDSIAQASAADALAQVTVDYAAEESVQETEPVQEANLVSEADIAALIAEAEKLEAEAVAHEAVDATGEIAGNIDLDATDAVEFGVADESFAPAAQIEAEPVAEYEPEVVVEEPVEVFAEAVAEQAAEPEPEPVAEMVAEAVVEVAAEPMVEVAADAVADVEVFAEAVAEQAAEPEAEPVTEMVAEAVGEIVAEPMVEVAADAVADVEVEAAADVEVEAVAEVEAAAEAVAFEPAAEVAEPEIAAAVADEPETEAAFEPAAEIISEPVAEIPAPRPIAAFARVEPFVATVIDGFTVDEPVVAVAIQQAVGRTHLAEIVPMVRAARAESGGNTLVALERLLAKVQARRSELMAQSVA